MPVELEDDGERHIAAAIAARSPNAAPSTKPTNEELVAICQAFVEQLRNGTAPWVVQRLNNTYGPMPTDHYSFSFWMALVRRFLINLLHPMSISHYLAWILTDSFCFSLFPLYALATADLTFLNRVFRFGDRSLALLTQS